MTNNEAKNKLIIFGLTIATIIPVLFIASMLVMGGHDFIKARAQYYEQCGYYINCNIETPAEEDKK